MDSKTDQSSDFNREVIDEKTRTAYKQILLQAKKIGLAVERLPYLWVLDDNTGLANGIIFIDVAKRKNLHAILTFSDSKDECFARIALVEGKFKNSADWVKSDATWIKAYCNEVKLIKDAWSSEFLLEGILGDNAENGITVFRCVIS